MAASSSRDVTLELLSEYLLFRRDESIVNCLQPHYFTLLASSGIDSVVHPWSYR